MSRLVMMSTADAAMITVVCLFRPTPRRGALGLQLVFSFVFSSVFKGTLVFSGAVTGRTLAPSVRKGTTNFPLVRQESPDRRRIDQN
ncbi:hypothetical protein GCM10010191_83270 [Actinomadura vinacea]|uniref:Secreted protein n=1 Tax=Actinomadura vinacea TaxID=115336 RepID=A0ABN3KBY7_9ACTN